MPDHPSRPPKAPKRRVDQLLVERGLAESRARAQALVMAGLILLAAAPCTAMVFVWSRLSSGDPLFTLSQVALNDLARNADPLSVNRALGRTPSEQK